MTTSTRMLLQSALVSAQAAIDVALRALDVSEEEPTTPALESAQSKCNHERKKDMAAFGTLKKWKCLNPDCGYVYDEAKEKG